MKRKICLNTRGCYNKPPREESNFCSDTCRLIYEGKIPPIRSIKKVFTDSRERHKKVIENNEDFIASLPETTEKERMLKRRWEDTWETDKKALLSFEDIKKLEEIYIKWYVENQDERGVKAGTIRGKYKKKVKAINNPEMITFYCKECKRKNTYLQAGKRKKVFCNDACRQKYGKEKRKREEIERKKSLF
jgi:hypothetical protein